MGRIDSAGEFFPACARIVFTCFEDVPQRVPRMRRIGSNQFNMRGLTQNFAQHHSCRKSRLVASRNCHVIARWSRLVRHVVCLITYCCVAGAAAQQHSTTTRPNIVFLMADDMGYGDVGAYNSASKIPTPNLDRLAAGGIRFTDAHSSSPSCTPTRYTIMTGRYNWRAGHVGNANYFDAPLIDSGRMTVASMLQAQGYATAAIGKWHVGLNVRRLDGTFVRSRRGQLPDVNEVDWAAPVGGSPVEYGFDYYFGEGGSGSLGPQVFLENRNYTATPVLTNRGIRAPGWNESLQESIQLDKALEYIDDHQSANEASGTQSPFFMYYASGSPHVPWTPGPIDGVPFSGASNAGRRGNEVAQFDAIVGQLVDKLEDLGIADDTLIIVTSDNGPHLNGDGTGNTFGHASAGDLRGKKLDLWEGGHRVPFIARWGDGTMDGSVIPPGLVSDEVVGLQDLMATVADLIGAELPTDAAEDSESILAALLGEQLDGPVRNPLIHQAGNGTFAVRDGEWKLILADDPATPLVELGQLYNLAEDLLETNNLYEQRLDVVARLTGTLHQYHQLGASARRLVGVPAPGALEGGIGVLLCIMLARGVASHRRVSLRSGRRHGTGHWAQQATRIVAFVVSVGWFR